MQQHDCSAHFYGNESKAVSSLTDIGMNKISVGHSLCGRVLCRVLAAALCTYAGFAVAQTAHTNLDEGKVRPYVLPSALTTPQGKTVRTVQQWHSQRAYLLQLFAENIYGRVPSVPPGMHFHLDSIDRNALNGLAIRSEVSIFLGPSKSSPVLHVLLYLPAHARGKVPVFVGLNFLGNHSTSHDQNITIQPNWLATQKLGPPARGIQASRWPFTEIVSKGYGVATAWYGDLEVDNPDGWKTGIRTTLAKPLHIQPQEWGALSVWAWGMSRIQDYLLTNSAVDSHRVIAIGHSRLGKASLWAGANDTRFAMVIANDSGEGGAALARRNFGETTADLNRVFPHWFIPRFQAFDDKPDTMPVDQHELLSLIAPRPLYIASATEDLWGDPKGEFLGAEAAGNVYELYGLHGVTGNFPPPVNTSIGDAVGYHLRTGKHDITLFDWEQYIAFANRTLKP